MFNKSCTPTQVYLLLSMMGLSYSIYSIVKSKNSKLAKAGATLFSFLSIYSWTLLLNLLCKNKHERIAWMVVFLPVVILFVIIAVFIMGVAGVVALGEGTPSEEQEGMCNCG